MIRRGKDQVTAMMRATLPPGVEDFANYARDSLYPFVHRVARKMGLTPMEAEECADRVLQAANGQLIAAYKRAHMRDRARRPQ